MLPQFGKFDYKLAKEHTLKIKNNKNSFASVHTASMSRKLTTSISQDPSKRNPEETTFDSQQVQRIKQNQNLFRDYCYELAEQTNFPKQRNHNNPN